MLIGSGARVGAIAAIVGGSLLGASTVLGTPPTTASTAPPIATGERYESEASLARRLAPPWRAAIDRFPLGPLDMRVVLVRRERAPAAAMALLRPEGTGLHVVAVHPLGLAKYAQFKSRWVSPDGRFGLVLASWRAVSARGAQALVVSWAVLRVDGDSLSLASSLESKDFVDVRFEPLEDGGLEIVRCNGATYDAARMNPQAGRFGPLTPTATPCVRAGMPDWLGEEGGE